MADPWLNNLKPVDAATAQWALAAHFARVAMEDPEVELAAEFRDSRTHDEHERRKISAGVRRHFAARYAAWGLLPDEIDEYLRIRRKGLRPAHAARVVISSRRNRGT